MRILLGLMLPFCLVLSAHAQDKNIFADFQTANTTLKGGNVQPINPRGAVGLFHTYSALKQPASPTSFGIGFIGNYSLIKDFPLTDQITERFDGGFFVNYTPIPYIEIFGSIGVVTTNDEEPVNPLLRQVPNFDYGIKATLPIFANLYGGLVYHGESRSGISNIPGSQNALNHDILGVVTYDMSGGNIPMRFHFNGGYRVDNNIRVAQTGADARVINVARAYGENALLLALGTEYVIDWAIFSLEYSIDSISSAGFSESPQRASLGTRFYPTQDRALGILAGLDIGTSGADASNAGVFLEENYSVYFGLHYLFGMNNQKESATFDGGSSEDFAIEATPTKKARTGKVVGYVTDIETGNPIEGARIETCKPEAGLVTTNASGGFTTRDLPEGPCAFTVEHPNYQTLNDQVNITPGVDVPYDFGLLRRQNVQVEEPIEQDIPTTRLILVAKDPQGNPVSASIYQANKKREEPFQLDASGRGEFDVEPGQYELYASFEGKESATKYLLLKDGEEQYVEFLFATNPAKVTISKDKKRIEISEKIQFEVGKAMLTYNSQRIVEQIASVMNQNPSIELLEVAGHTDSVGDATFNLELSQSRADAVKDKLIEFGVAPNRLRSVGYGEDFPIADNETEEGKYANRRVEFRILKR